MTICSQRFRHIFKYYRGDALTSSLTQRLIYLTVAPTGLKMCISPNISYSLPLRPVAAPTFSLMNLRKKRRNSPTQHLPQPAAAPNRSGTHPQPQLPPRNSKDTVGNRCCDKQLTPQSFNSLAFPIFACNDIKKLLNFWILTIYSVLNEQSAQGFVEDYETGCLGWLTPRSTS